MCSAHVVNAEKTSSVCLKTSLVRTPRRKAFSRCSTCLVSEDSVWRIVGSRGPHHRPNCNLSKRHVSGNLNLDDNVRMRGRENLSLPPCKQKHLLFLKQKLGRKIT